jgi:hypothetical protein
MSWGGFSNPGGVNTKSYLVGDWEEVLAIKNNQIYRLGNCSGGILRIANSYYRHRQTGYDHKIDFVALIRTGMSFGGTIEEINAQNVSMLLGQTMSVGAQNYLYVGAQSSTYYFTLRGNRVRPQDNLTIEFQIHKCLQTSLFSLANGDDVFGSPLDVEGLDDAAGDYGGNDSMPLGWIYVPSGLPVDADDDPMDGGWMDGLPDYGYDDGWTDGLPDFTFD